MHKMSLKLKSLVLEESFQSRLGSQALCTAVNLPVKDK